MNTGVGGYLLLIYDPENVSVLALNSDTPFSRNMIFFRYGEIYPHGGAFRFDGQYGVDMNEKDFQGRM